MASKKSSKKTKGSVGFLYGGTIKIGSAFMYYSDSIDPSDEIQKYLKYYGSNVQSRYIKCETPKVIYESILEKLKEDDSILFDSLVSCHTSSLVTIIKEVAQVNQAHKFKRKVVEDEDEDENDDEDEDEEEVEEEEKVVSKSSKKTDKKAEEKKVVKKVVKKSKGPAKKSKDESDEELSEEDDSSDEESEVEEIKEVKVEKKKNTKETKVKGKK